MRGIHIVKTVLFESFHEVMFVDIWTIWWKWTYRGKKKKKANHGCVYLHSLVRHPNHFTAQWITSMLSLDNILVAGTKAPYCDLSSVEIWGYIHSITLFQLGIGMIRRCFSLRIKWTDTAEGWGKGAFFIFELSEDRVVFQILMEGGKRAII